MIPLLFHDCGNKGIAVICEKKLVIFIKKISSNIVTNLLSMLEPTSFA